ncbi:pilus assembly protein [Fundidesulfovibrio putealis]|uniref:pilus assembly protein n=1 Tax=Fundidesulfovibrio putealis TaxID=270496 RepID=UPI000A04EA52|nr:pilus assembly protein [Fundidesulfovibrio putealis]
MSRRAVLLFVLVLAALSGCTKKHPQIDAIEHQGQQFRDQARSRAVEVTPKPYLGAKAVEFRGVSNPVLNKYVTLKRKGTLPTIAAAISELTSMPVQLAAQEPEEQKQQPRSASPGSSHGQAPASTPPSAPAGGVNMDLEALLAVPGSTSAAAVGVGDSRQLSVSYEGPLRGLLNHVAMLSGYGWDYDASSGNILFARMMVKTYTILGAPGTVTFENKVTNKSKENSTSALSGSNINSTVSSSDTASQTSQSTGTKLSFDIFADTEKGVKALLSPKGSVVVNQAAGTLTVRDTPDSIRRVSSFIEDINGRLGRQVALTVQVWSLSISDNTDVGFNLQAIFEDKDVSITAGSLTNIGTLNTAAATIVSGKLKGSSAVLQALRQWGKASQVTSAGGLVMSNQPVPVMAIERHAYLASAGVSTTNYQQTTELTPGEVTTGFAMTVIPHILDQRRVILQYNINLSSLEEMKEFEASDITIQLPQTSTRAFAQRSTMRMGQTLVLCGFEKQSTEASTSLGIPSTGRVSKAGRTLLVITIQVESAEV